MEAYTDAKFADMKKEILQQNETLKVNYEVMQAGVETLAEMQAYRCAGNYDGSLMAYENLAARHAPESIPEPVRVPIYVELLRAYANKGNYERLNKEEVDRIAKPIEASGKAECSINYLQIGGCYLAVGEPESARPRLIRAVRLEQRSRVPDIVTVSDAYSLLLVAALMNPSERSVDQKTASAGQVLEECESMEPVAYARIHQMLNRTSWRSERRLG